MSVRPQTRAAPLAPVAGDEVVDFGYRDRRVSLRAVRLVPALSRFAGKVRFERTSRTTWRLRYARPEVDRLEYQLELERADGSTELLCDPANPLRAPGPFGPKSVVEFPGYEPPAWIIEDPPPGNVTQLTVRSRPFRKPLRVLVWSSANAEPGRPLPLLVVHDGPETAEYSSLLRLLNVSVGTGSLPPMRAALLAPIDRDQHYSASAAYARTLAWDVLPGLAEAAPTPYRRRMRVGLGASLGALAMLHAHRQHPETFGALFLQSGSFFRARTDRQESSFARFERISRFVGKILRGVGEVDPIDVTLTCGTVEENLANNRAVAGALASQGYDVRFHEHRDAHNWIAWRDVYDPWLVELLQRKWG